MADFDIHSMMAKVTAFSKTKRGQKMMRDKINEYVEAGVEKTEAGGDVTTGHDVYEITRELIADLQNSAARLCAIGELPKSVADHFDSLDIAGYTDKYDERLGMRFYNVDIIFKDDLSRSSLVKLSVYKDGGIHGRYDGSRTGLGMQNIVALFEFGHMMPHESNVRGYWESQDAVVRAKTDRQGLGMIQEVLDNFNSKYFGEAEAWLTWKPDDYI